LAGGARVIARHEPAHPGAQQGLLDVDGYRITCFLTDQPDTDIVELDRRHRAHARVEDRIRNAKATGLRNLPFADFRRSEVWVELVLAAQDLLAWTQLICLDGQLAKTESKTLRYRLLLAGFGNRLFWRSEGLFYRPPVARTVNPASHLLRQNLG
jgi:Transposase DDE domain group 1